MRNPIRGLYVIRSGGAVPGLRPRVSETEPEEQRAEADDQRQDTGTDGQQQDTEPDDGRLATLRVDFSRFNTWYEVDSIWEGHFLERVAPGAFKRTLEHNGSRTKVLFNHGFDFHIGDKILGVPERWGESRDTAWLEAPLLDTSYNRDLLPGLRAGGYGSSFMFEVTNEQWNHEPERSEYNPEGLPERTITEVKLYEAGPVTWPANPEATAGVRSGTDWYIEAMAAKDPDRRDEVVRLYKAFRALHGLRTPTSESGSRHLQTSTPPTSAPGVIPARHVNGLTKAKREALLRAIALDSVSEKR